MACGDPEYSECSKNSNSKSTEYVTVARNETNLAQVGFYQPYKQTKKQEKGFASMITGSLYDLIKFHHFTFCASNTLKN